MKLSTDHHDSDSTHSPLDDKEKVVGVEKGGFETLGRGQLPPDPDAALSEEERALIVSIIYYTPLILPAQLIVY